MEEKREQEIKQKIESILENFNALQPEEIEKIPQLKKIKDAVTRQKEVPSGEYTVTYPVEYTVWENYAVAV